ncbi:MAG TPA: chromate transporter [Noviherbaspirillum sp.]|nr:chromate transporter [Noviherbaspirillum sp.]
MCTKEIMEPDIDRPAATHRPRSPADLFVAFTVMAIQGFGGVLGIVQHELVERRKWLTREEFLEHWTMAQVMPGPNVVNLSLMVGASHFGLRGALAALMGLILLPLVLVLALAMVYRSFAGHPAVGGAIKGMSIVAAALITANGIRLFSGLRSNPLGKYLCAAAGGLAFFATAVLRLPLVYVILGVGIPASVIAYLRVAK